MRTPRPVPSSLVRFSPLAAALACVLVPEAMAATYIVNDASNDTTVGPCVAAPAASSCSLHQAMQMAQSTCDTNAIIEFNLPSPFTISPSSPLPAIADCLGPIQVKVTLNGYSQPGAAQNTLANGFDAVTPVVIDGTAAAFAFCGLTTGNFSYGEGGLAITGLTVRNFSYGGAVGICGNVEVTGSRILDNDKGISAYDTASIGGAAPEQRNVVSGNIDVGIFLSGSASPISVINNYVGTNDAGTAAVSNNQGIYVSNTPGSTVEGNLVSGNNFTGIIVSQSDGTTIRDNAIGTDVTRSVAIPNSIGSFARAVEVVCSPNAALLDNNISSNQYGGVFLAGVDQAVIQGNSIGIGGDGATALANAGHGLELGSGGFCGEAKAKNLILFGTNLADISGNVIANNAGSGVLISEGGDNSLIGNTIKQNQEHGVRIVQGTGNEISGNSVYGNALAGSPFKNLDLDFYGGPFDALPNDAGDVDTGPNERLNHPVVSLVTQSGGNTTAAYSYNGLAAERSYNAEFYSNLAAGVPAGKILVATIPFATDATGNFSGSAAITGAWDNISALAIDQATGDTSEFSSAVALTPTPEVAMTPASPATLSFANTVVGASSGTQSVTLTSVGTAPYVVNSFTDATSCEGGPICSSGAFICANSCSPATPYAPSSSCSIDVTFSPIDLGPTSETFYICDNAPGTPRSVTLTGTAIPPPPPTVAPASHSFGSVQVGTVSAPHTFTFTNPAPVSVTISSATISGPFQIVNNGCVGSVSYGGNCTIDARFAPVASEPAEGALTVAMSSGTATSTLSGSGTPTPPATMTPPSLDFGIVVVGSPSAPGTLTISNPAATPVTLSAFTVTPPFLLHSTTCTSSLPPVSTCEALVKFLPTASGSAIGTISAVAGFGTISSGLVGNGATNATLQLAPTSHDFGTIPVGSSASKDFTVTNPAATTVTLSPPSVNPPYQIASTTCTSSLPPSGTCVASVKFVPGAHGTVAGTLSVASSSGTPTSTLVGTGLWEPVLTMPTGAIDLGTLTLGSAPALHQVTLTNTGNAALNIDAISVGRPFTVTNSCPASLLPGASCVATIELNPTALGTFSASLSVLTNAPGGSRSIAVRGRVQPRPEPLIRVSPSSIGFGDRMGGTQTPSQRITVRNEGGADAVALDLSINTPHFLIVNTTCGNVLAPQATCFANVVFQPTGFGPKRATLNVTTSNAPTVGVGLSGAGCRPPQASLGRSPRLSCAP